MKGKSFGENKRIYVNILIAAVSIVIATATLILSLRTILTRNRQITTELVFDYLYNEVENAFEKPVHVVTTMAGDVFFREYLERETAVPSVEFCAGMAENLRNVRDGNQLDSAYFTSARTLNYYSAKGLEKVIDPASNDYDRWYTNFVDSGADYDLDAEFDEKNGEIWTVFVDKRMEDKDGELIGVCTVGVKLASIQEMIAEIEAKYGVSIYFTDLDGITQMSSGGDGDSAFILDTDNHGGPDEQFAYETRKAFVISRRIPRLDWYLVVENTQNVFGQVLSRAVVSAFAVILLLVLGLLTANAAFSSRAALHFLKLSETDSLTRIMNRKGVENAVRAFLSGKDNRHVGGALFILDVDNFKSVNDSFGHAAGDRVLLETANFLKSEFRAGDMIGRIGGDEFVVFSPGMKDQTLVEKKARAVITKAVHEVAADGKSIEVSISMGVALFPMHGDSYEELTEKADRALYEVKENGRNNFKIYG